MNSFSCFHQEWLYKIRFLLAESWASSWVFAIKSHFSWAYIYTTERNIISMHTALRAEIMLFTQEDLHRGQTTCPESQGQPWLTQLKWQNLWGMFFIWKGKLWHAFLLHMHVCISDTTGFKVESSQMVNSIFYKIWNKLKCTTRQVVFSPPPPP